MEAGAGGDVAYEFAQPPAAVPPRRAPYRDPMAAPVVEAPSNIMWDRRVVRGNTYAAQTLPPSALAEQELAAQRQEATRRRQDMEASRKHAASMKPRTPPPVEGRRHMDAQTDQYLEELTDKVPEADGTTQTDPFMDRPPTPLFMPTKTGEDKWTQVEPGYLFDFDREVEPILEVLVGKTLEQALMEVHEDLELENIRARQREFEQIRNVELAEVQRLEAEARRKFAEKQRRVEQERARVTREAQVKEKVAAASFARAHLSNMMNNVFEQLVDSGHFYDPLTREVETDFLPRVYGRVASAVSAVDTAQRLADDLIRAALKLGEAKHQAELDRLAAEAKKRAEEEAARRKAAEEEAARKAAEEEAARKAAEEAEAAGEGEDDGDD